MGTDCNTTSFPLETMFNSLRTLGSRVARQASIAGIVLAAVTVAACSTERALGPSTESAQASPAPATHELLMGIGTIPKKALLRRTALKTAITRSFTVTATGGTLTIPEVGFTLTVPAKAFNGSSLTIKVTALAGSAVAYAFEPHGAQFLSGLSMAQDLAVTTWSKNSSFMLLGGGYFKNDAQVNTSTGAALIDETLPVVVLGTKSYMKLWHFSGYMISMD